MRKIVYTRPDGGVSVVHPVRNTHPRVETLTDAEIEQRAWNKLPPDAINPQFVEEAAIPRDRTFRHAWKRGQGGVEVDMAAARKHALRDAPGDANIEAARTPEELKVAIRNVITKT